MENRKRITNILIAGTLTIFMLAVFLAFRSSGETVSADEGSLTAESTVEDAAAELVGEQEANIVALQAQFESLQAQNSAYAEQNEELRSAVITLQERESEYQTQIEEANQTINDLSAQAGGFTQGDQGFGDQSFGDQGFGDQGFGDPFQRPHEHTH